MASVEERIDGVECAVARLATKADMGGLSADIKDLEARKTRLICVVGVGILISVIGGIVSIALSLARLF